MPLKVVLKVQIQCQPAAVRRVDCSKFLDLQPKNSCRQVECLFSEQWERWRERSETGGVRSPRSAGSRRPGTMVRLRRTGEMWSRRLALVRKRAAAFWIDCRCLNRLSLMP